MVNVPIAAPAGAVRPRLSGQLAGTDDYFDADFLPVTVNTRHLRLYLQPGIPVLEIDRGMDDNF